jgi:ubiquinone/menaquinone biosynthesis C-methylase UbiE
VTEPLARATDAAFLQYQYGTPERLQVRVETHQRYSERTDDFMTWVLDQLEPRPGDLALDVGCGTGAYHAGLCARGAVMVVGIDTSPAMVSASQQQARAQRLPVNVLRADAQRLPLADGAFDRGMANHMLYHVSDQLLALRELRRVLKPGSRVVLATGASDQGKVLSDLHDRAARQLGYAPSGRMGGRFNLDHLPLVQEVFPTAERRIREDAFLFPTSDAVLRYYASGAVDALDDAPADGSHRARLLELVGEQVEAIIARAGVFRVSKNTGCFVADKH